MSASLVERLRHLIPDSSFPSEGESHQATASMLTNWMQNASSEVCEEALDILFSLPIDEWKQSALLASSTLVGFLRNKSARQANVAETTLNGLQNTYQQLDSHPAIQAILLRLCVMIESKTSLEMFADLVASTTEMDSRLQVEVFGDLLRLEKDVARGIFPKLLAAIDNPIWCALVMDYANFTYRNEVFDVHPASEQTAKLNSLLSTVAERLQQLQDAPPESNEERLRLGKQVTESVAICIALCDAMACIGDESAVASLNKALQVEHRRLRVEAAAALAKLGVEDAKKVLTAMAAEPAERLRVLAYADELGVLDDVEEEFSNVVAKAEAEFVMHLAQPTQIGLAPQHIELLDQREQAWPGYEEPRSCFLLQFVYQFPSGEFTNIGIAGPVVMTFESDLSMLTYDDIYALFAGWHVEHPDIFHVDVQQVAGQNELHLQRMMRSLTESEEYEEVHPVLLGNLLERRFLVASAMRGGDAGWAMVSEDEISWLGIGNPQRPLGAGEAFYLFVGRSLLRSFN